MVFIGVCAKRSETAAYGVCMLALISSLLLTVACHISSPTSYLSGQKMQLISPHTEAGHACILLEYCSNLPPKESTYVMFRLLVRVTLLTIFSANV